MRRFRFRLDSVLGWRVIELELEETKLERLFAERHSISAELLQIEDRRRAAAAVIAAKTLDGQQLSALDEHRRYLAREVERLLGKRSDCEKRILAQQQRVIEAERRLRLLERLKERRLGEWTHDFNRELEELASEAFLAKWARKK
jgi:flagellar biosynthesis chaperone FliJ